MIDVARIKVRREALVVAVAVLCFTACSERKMSWYDESKGYDQQRQERIDTLVGQGAALTSAAREADLESAIRNTERGPGVPPLEGADLQNALRASQSVEQ
ncbi:MAG: hypothetical protein V1929_05300 [bacterium]